MRDTLASALKDAMKARDPLTVSTIRLLQAAIKDRDIANHGLGKGPLGDDEILQILAKLIKQREESARLYEDGGRPELAEKERSEIVVINRFLPTQLSADEVTAICAAVIAEIGAAGIKDMGRVMAVLKERYPGQMDFGKASAVLKGQLTAA